MSTPPLPPDLMKAVMARLGVKTAVPDLKLLDALMNAYIRTVPWESAFRIAKRERTMETADCPRWPHEFWQDNIQRGGGGTCFESNYAFFSLLRALGYEGYLTINNMGDSIGCHTAIILLIGGVKWLVDAGLPLFAPLPVSPYGVMHRATAFMHFTVWPDVPGIYQIERGPHPFPNAFTLIDKPVPDVDYREAATADYDVNGHFLDRVIVSKIINNRPWRFNEGELPWRLNSFGNGVRTDHELEGDVETAVAQHFSMDEEIVRQAFAVTS